LSSMVLTVGSRPTRRKLCPYVTFSTTNISDMSVRSVSKHVCRRL
jgi:hypothetical protein